MVIGIFSKWNNGQYSVMSLSMFSIIEILEIILNEILRH